MTVWYTSDLHLGHGMVAGLRGFADSVGHDRAVADNWRSVVRPDDVVWVLGDVTLGKRGLDEALDLLKDLPGRKHLIAGNHDECHPLHRRAHRWQRRYLDAFESVQPFATRRIDGRQVLLSHFPLTGDHTAKERFDAYRLRDTGIPVWHGHTHGRERVTFTERDTVQVHVGLDAWGLALVSEATLVTAMDAAIAGRAAVRPFPYSVVPPLPPGAVAWDVYVNDAFVGRIQDDEVIRACAAARWSDDEVIR